MKRFSPVPLYLLFLSILGLLLILSGCASTGGDEGGGDGGGGSGTGTLLLSLTDAPLDNLVKFEITIVAVELDPGNVLVLTSPVRVEVTSAQLTSKVIRLASGIPAGSYSSVTIQFSNPEIKFCPDPPQTCSTPTEINPTLANSTVTRNVSLTVTEDGGVGLVLDFDLEASVQTNAIGTITGVDPQVTVSVQNLGNADDEFEAKGKVLSVTRDTSTSFVLEAFGGCQRITVTVDEQTQFEDFDSASLANSFQSLMQNQIVEVEADAASTGAILANKVELEEATETEEVEGTVLSVTRNGTTGAATQFRLVAQELQTCASGALSDDLVTVNIDGNTQFRVDSDLTGVDPNLFNDARDIAIGQKVEVKPTGLLETTMTAARITLEEQTIGGRVSTSDPANNVFRILPTADTFETLEIQINASNDTQFDGVAGVINLFSGQKVRVRGPLFLTEGQLVLVAERVEAEVP